MGLDVRYFPDIHSSIPFRDFIYMYEEYGVCSFVIFHSCANQYNVLHIPPFHACYHNIMLKEVAVFKMFPSGDT